MSEQLTLQCRLEDRTGLASQLPSGYELAIAQPRLIPALGQLYFSAYPPGVAAATLDAAVQEIQETFRGAYGELWPEASPVLLSKSVPVGAVMTVHRAPWTDTPQCPFIIETFVHETHRRHGLARFLMISALNTAFAAGHHEVALRVLADNTPARLLYESLGFEPWSAIADSNAAVSKL